ncbi:hypothetical protein C8R46DRAFT_1030565 [Mycena filopes]|nr:hypothetical protein C8R46DRAFT_1030565 [Mycena filopes]
MSGRISRSSPLHPDKEAFNDDWNEFNDLGHSANKFRPIGSNIRSVSCSSVEYPFGFLFVGRISVRFPVRRHCTATRTPSTTTRRSAITSIIPLTNSEHPTRLLGRISVRFPVRRHCTATRTPSTTTRRSAITSIIPPTNSEHPTRLLGRISVRFPYLPRVFVAFRDMDANDLEKYACRRPCTFVPTTPHSTRILVPLCGPHRLGKIGSAYPYALQSPGPTRLRLSSSRFRVQLIGMSAHEDINLNIHTQLCWVPRSFGQPIFFPVLAPNSSTFLLDLRPPRILGSSTSMPFCEEGQECVSPEIPHRVAEHARMSRGHASVFRSSSAYAGYSVCALEQLRARSRSSASPLPVTFNGIIIQPDTHAKLPSTTSCYPGTIELAQIRATEAMLVLSRIHPLPSGSLTRTSDSSSCRWKVQRLASKIITGALRTTATDLLDFHFNLLPFTTGGPPPQPGHLQRRRPHPYPPHLAPTPPYRKAVPARPALASILHPPFPVLGSESRYEGGTGVAAVVWGARERRMKHLGERGNTVFESEVVGAILTLDIIKGTPSTFSPTASPPSPPFPPRAQPRQYLPSIAASSARAPHSRFASTRCRCANPRDSKARTR